MRRGTPRPLLRSLLALLLGLLLVEGCGSDGGGPHSPGSPPPPPVLTLWLSAPSLSIQAGDRGSVTATANVGATARGTLHFAVAGTPSGVTAGASNVTATADETSGTISLIVDAGVAAGTYPVTITATRAEGASVVAALRLIVTAAAPPASDS